MSIRMSFKLDLIDRRILYELDKNCRISDNKLAKLVNRSRESVRNRIKKLVKDGIIEAFITSLNPSKAGYMFFKLYCQLRPDPEIRKKFFDYLNNIKGIYWYGTNDGNWDMHTAIYAKDVKTFNDIKNNIYFNFKDLILKKDTGVLVKTRQYVKKYLIDKYEELPERYFAGEIELSKIDELDIKIINVIIMNARTSLVEIAKKCNSTVEIIRKRMKDMENNGIIIQYRIAIDHNKLNYIMFKSFIYFDNLSEQEKNKFIEYCKINKNIIYCVEQLSSWDFEIEIIAENYIQFYELMNDIRTNFKNSLRNYEFSLMMEDKWVFKEKVFI